jgi:hypothetical protein
MAQTFTGYGKQIKGNTKVISPGDDIQAAYDLLANDGSMGALSATNWRTLILSPGTYDIAVQLDFDTDFIAITGTGDSPKSTILLGGLTGLSLIQQTTDTLSLSNFTVAVNGASPVFGGFWIRGCDNTLSRYEDMIFDSVGGSINLDGLCGAVEQTNFKGIWINCMCADFGFRITGRVNQTLVVATMAGGQQPSADDTLTQANSGAEMVVISSTDTTITGVVTGAWDTTNTFTSDDLAGPAMDPATNTPTSLDGPVEFAPTMIDCHSFSNIDKAIGTGEFCFGGDGIGPFKDTLATQNSTGVIMNGTYYNCSSGLGSFSGCLAFGVPIGPDAKFYNCHALSRSFGMSCVVEGTFWNCSVGYTGFAGVNEGLGFASVFSGTAYNCTVGYDVTSDIGNTAFGSGSLSKCTGKLINCRAEQMDKALRLEGATIDGSRLKAGDTNEDCVTIIDSLSKIYDSTLIADGTGKSIGAGAALNVISAHNRMNLGLHGDVTNLIGTSYDVIDTDIA